MRRAEKIIGFAVTDAEIESCYEVITALRPHFDGFEDFRLQFARQVAKHDFRLAFLTDGVAVRAVAGIRTGEWLAGGKYLEIEDLVTADGERSKGHGGELFDWLVEFARRENCDQIRLVSHVTRFGAHRFYLRKGMNIEAHYFSMTV